MNKISILIISGGILVSSFAYADGFVISNYDSGITLSFTISGMSKNPLNPGDYAYATTGKLSPTQGVIATGIGSEVINGVKHTDYFNCFFVGPDPVAWTPKAYPIPVANNEKLTYCPKTSICCKISGIQ